MTNRSTRRKPIAVKSAELALTVPHVIAHRIARMAAAGPVPTMSDRVEFIRMHVEKTAACFESWNAMTLQAWRANHAFNAAIIRALFLTGAGRHASVVEAASRLTRHSAAIVHKGLDPVHRRVIANARRLTTRR